MDREHGAPIVPIRVGKLKISHALLDYGASMSVLPGDLYDMYEFGPLEDVDTMVSLADESWRRPRGIVKNVMIRLGEFEYPVDFLVLDYPTTTMASQQRVILGRPFLYTANAQIDCREGIINMTEKNRKLSFDVQIKVISYESIEGKGGESSDCIKKVFQIMRRNHPPDREEKHMGSSKSVFDYPSSQNKMDAFCSMAQESGGDGRNRFFEPP
ncbi:putative aspartic peptidase domain superfamily [Helianthus debilis subsp. tardiflorus]